MREFKKISYPSKFKEYIDRFGEDEGSEEYYRFLRRASLEKCILKYGEVEGKKEWERISNNIKNSGVSLKNMIEKYGEEEGKKKYEDWKLNTKQNLDGFIKRYGEEKGKIKYKEFQKKCSIATTKRGKNDNSQNARCIEYWLKKYDNDIEKAKLELSKFQNNSSLDKYQKKYGTEKGLRKYLEDNKKKAISLENMIKLYGEIEGEKRYNSWLEKIRYTNSSKGIIEKHGKEYYDDLIKRKTQHLYNGYSNIGLEFCINIYNEIKDDFDDIYFGDNEYSFFIFEDDFKICRPDFYIKDINLVIEFYGDYWHKNPNIYTESMKFVKDKWDFDKERINKIKNKFNSNIIIVWENDYRKDKKNTIDIIINEIEKIKTNKYGNN